MDYGSQNSSVEGNLVVGFGIPFLWLLVADRTPHRDRDGNDRSRDQEQHDGS